MPGPASPLPPGATGATRAAGVALPGRSSLDTADGGALASSSGSVASASGALDAPWSELRARRIARGWSVEELAELAGVDADRLGAAELGMLEDERRTMRPRVLEALARVDRARLTEQHIERYGVAPQGLSIPRLAAPRRFGEAVLQARNGLDLDIHQMARDTGIRASTLRLCEAGESALSDWEIRQVCEYLGLDEPRRAA